MKFAVVEGERREPHPGFSAECPGCGNAMIAKCGQHRVWHWAHRGTRSCDAWWESETEWHRGWKNHFPKDWQEIIHGSKDGEKHIADVKTEGGVVLEFQHSLLRRDERESREAFYPKMVWVVDGRRRARDRAQFFASLGAAMVVNRTPLMFSVPSNGGALLRDWEASRVPVYFDFGIGETGDTSRFDTTALWRLNPRSRNARAAYLSPVARTEFLRVHLEGLPFDEICTEFVERAMAYYLMRQASRSRPLTYSCRDQQGEHRVHHWPLSSEPNHFAAPGPSGAHDGRDRRREVKGRRPLAQTEQTAGATRPHDRDQRPLAGWVAECAAHAGDLFGGGQGPGRASRLP